MDEGIMQFISLLAVVYMLTFFSCKGDDNSNFDGEKLPTKINIKKITYRFEDSSVPPEYHRSYTITLTPERVNIVVDSYGDFIAQKEYKIRKKQFINIVNSLAVNNIRKQPLFC
jgi:hypothetical protein